MLESGLNPDIFYYFLAVFFARGPVDICCSMGEQAQQTRFSEAAAFTEQEKTLCGSILWNNVMCHICLIWLYIYMLIWQFI